MTKHDESPSLQIVRKLIRAKLYTGCLLFVTRDHYCYPSFSFSPSGVESRKSFCIKLQSYIQHTNGQGPENPNPTSGKKGHSSGFLAVPSVLITTENERRYTNLPAGLGINIITVLF